MDVWAEIILLVLAAFAVLALFSISRYLEVLATEMTALRMLVEGEAEIGRAEQARLN
jgi:hypothetical protein